jgi:hypothetical protein
MQTLDSLVIDRLGERARGVGDARIATGLSVPGSRWVGRARRQARRLRPEVSVVFFGGNDGFDLKTPDGTTVSCCEEAWIEAYSRRAEAMMRAYVRGGAASVLWLTAPAPRSAASREITAADNEAVRRAAERLPNVRVLALDEVFTPGFRYRVSMTYRGRRVRVRAPDGVHLSLAGLRIAATLVMRDLRKLL